MTISQLLESFTAAAVARDRAELMGETAKFRPLMQAIFNIEREMKGRAGDQRRALMKLYDHPNIEVRLHAAKATLTVAPIEARRVLKAVSDSNRFPQAADAGMTLAWLDDGRFKPN